MYKTDAAVCGSPTLKRLLLTGLMPVGSTMYVWGGGWNAADTEAGDEARMIGVSPKWKSFFQRQGSDYDYRKTRYQILNGLDCSGYIGWCIYNIMNTKNGERGYVMPAEKMASDFASRGWGTYVARSEVKDYRAGDIMSTSGHVWMAVGQCGDGSVVLLHSSPPGVQLAGTLDQCGRTDSRAVQLARYYMKVYFPEWYKKYPDCGKGKAYLTDYSRMRWDISGKAVMSDPENYRNKTADQILEDLFCTKRSRESRLRDTDYKYGRGMNDGTKNFRCDKGCGDDSGGNRRGILTAVDESGNRSRDKRSVRNTNAGEGKCCRK